MRLDFFKTGFCICSLALAGTPLFSQYKMDLSQVKPSDITYLKMGNPGPQGKEIRITNLYLEESGVPQLPVMGEFHYNRLDHRYWRDALLKMKATGVNIVSTYILWVLHEEFEGRQDWTGRNDLRRFVQLCGELGLKVHLRIGPYCNAEIRNGGFPDWMEFNKNIRLRTNDPRYLEYVRYWYESVYKQIGDLQYKDGGPIVALQLENEYVTPGLVIPHMMKLKEIALSTGFDLPIYSMTHWMMSDYPKGEIIPYAGYYMETPWVYNGDKENPTTPQEFFSYNRISENIGNDFIKIDKGVESLTSETNNTPYFTCENGLGAPTYYQRRGIVPEKTAGENINLRLGCGVNLMGYYVYVGQTNPIGERYVMHRATARISNDYQAPIKEFGTMGIVMNETKKMNYFMNDFGSELAPLVAYLPQSNQNTDNLQWAVRTDGQKGYLFVSNYLHKHDRKVYEKVRFSIKLQDETLTLPEKKTTIQNGVYFFWPFNQSYGNIQVRYATVQPICKYEGDGMQTFFFFADDQIDGEYLIRQKDVKQIKVTNGEWKREKDFIRIHKLVPGKDCVAEMVNENGQIVRYVTLSEPESDMLWRGKKSDKDYVILTKSTVVVDSGRIKLMSENAVQEAWIYGKEGFVRQQFTLPEKKLIPQVEALSPLQEAQWIRPLSGKMVQRSLDATSLSKVEKAFLRLCTEGPSVVHLNGKTIKCQDYGDYQYANVSGLFKNGVNQLQIVSEEAGKGVVAEVEVLLENGTRWMFHTDGLWYGEKENVLVERIGNNKKPQSFAPEEHLGIFKIGLPEIVDPYTPVRLYINFKGDIGNAYTGDKLIHDCFNNGADWIIGLNRYTNQIQDHSVIVRIDGLRDPNAPIYFEKGIDKRTFVSPGLNGVRLEHEYAVYLKN